MATHADSEGRTVLFLAVSLAASQSSLDQAAAMSLVNRLLSFDAAIHGPHPAVCPTRVACRAHIQQPSAHSEMILEWFRLRTSSDEFNELFQETQLAVEREAEAARLEKERLQARRRLNPSTFAAIRTALSTPPVLPPPPPPPPVFPPSPSDS
jgi:hypothetical protein